MKITERLAREEMVVVKYRELQVEMTGSELVSRLDNDVRGKVLGTSAEYKLEEVDFGTNPITVTVTQAVNMIDSAHVVDSITNMIQKKSIGLAHIQIELNVKKTERGTVPCNTIGYITIPENLAVRKNVFKIEDSFTFRNPQGTKTFDNNSNFAPTLEILSVIYRQDNEQGRTVMIKDLFMSIDADGQYRFFRLQGGKMFDIETNEVLTAPLSLRRYKAFGASPSNDRQEKIYFIDVTEGLDRANKTLDTLTWGSYSLHLGEKVSYNKLAKLATRWFQWMAPSIGLGGDVNCLAVYFGKFNEDRADGMGLSSAEAMSEHIFQHTGIRIAPEALEGVFWQGRACQTKAGYMNTKEAYIKEVINSLDANPIKFDWDEITPEVINDIIGGKYSNRVVIFGNGTIEFLMDKNILKSDYDYSIKPEYTLLRFLRSNESNFSSTIFSKMVYKNVDRTVAYVKKIVGDDIVGRWNRAYMEPTAKVLKPEELTSKFFMIEVIKSVFPSYITMDRNVGMNILDNITKAVNKIFTKFKVPMNGKNSGLTVGLEVFFRMESIIGDHEVICPAAERMLKQAGIDEADWKIFMIKYPSMDVDEYQIAKVISRAEVKKRIRTLDVSKEFKSMLIDYYCKLHDSAIVVPACELFKKMLAGSDFDTDQACWSIDQELIAILDHDPVAICIED